ncbi:hypothetical protein PENTCL1PPCAC_776 [Pristionchus entomophagus]|uniref:Uncharacterized protein n=1 Tax=Pristionchus entomophagus TaxID=358040 RepID=A0AAV5S6V9_9BILA|nr:hypothetical protein PENTCL1PPCAC_776 [Pristionchus entomophagus]
MRQVVLRPSRVFAARLRAFSTETATRQPAVLFVGKNSEQRQNALLGPSAAFPLPGDVSVSPAHSLASPASASSMQTAAKQENAPLSSLPTHSLIELTSYPTLATSPQKAQENYLAEFAPSDLDVEMVAQPCPKLMQRDLNRLFPGMNIPAANVTVLNLAQQTKFDQKAWTPEMETERDTLTASFISAASDICSTLQRCGYWADFVDPASGRPYLGKFVNTSLFETDDAYRKMGFKIEDLGCCKVLQHAAWGSRAFVGTIFTDAPVDSQIVRDMITKLRD